MTQRRKYRNMDNLMGGVHETVVSRKKVDNNTIEWVDEKCNTHWRLHDTDILIKYYVTGYYKLESGGWRTVTTKDRMNKYLPPGWSVGSDKGVWYVYHGGWNGEKHPYSDGMFIDCIHGVITGGGTKTDVKAELAFRKAVTKFVKRIKDEGPPDPSQGDCFFCQMGKSDDSCLRNHVRENYLHGSLIVSAMKWGGYNMEYLGYQGKDTLARTTKRFILAKCGYQA